MPAERVRAESDQRRFWGLQPQLEFAIDNLTALQRQAAALRTMPSAWMPWNYQETLAGLGAVIDSG